MSVAAVRHRERERGGVLRDGRWVTHLQVVKLLEGNRNLRVRMLTGLSGKVLSFAFRRMSAVSWPISLHVIGIAGFFIPSQQKAAESLPIIRNGCVLML